jgi:acetolactate synthase-1/2/3 large subunit
MSVIRKENVTVAEGYLSLMADRGVEYLFANAGTDFAPLIEALAKAEIEGTECPKAITVPHENVAVGMALGYYLVSGRPQLVMVHVNVGTANAICGLMNAWRGNVPILFSAGRTPHSESGGLLGQRSLEIHWPQEMRDQGALVREIVKWDYELPNSAVLEATIDRAINVAMSEPRGPIYLTLPREILATEMSEFTYSSPHRRRTPSDPYPDPSSIDEAAEMISKAENPVIITSCAGRDALDVQHLSALAESFALPVVQRKPRFMVLPTDHEMHLGYDADSFLDSADLIVVLDCDVPWIPSKKGPKYDCKIVHISVDPLFASYPMRGFHSDLSITGVLRGTLPLLTAALIGRQAACRDKIEARRQRLAHLRADQRMRWLSSLQNARNENPLHPAWVTHCIDEIKSTDAILVKESPLSLEHLTFTQPGTFFSVGTAGGLGWGLGTALGMKLAARDRQVICTVGDGAYMFGNPIPTHYVAKAENLPILTVVFNNQMWGAVKRTTHDVYPGGFAARSNREPLTYFETPLAFEKAVEIAGGHGECVHDPAEMKFALRRAVEAIEKGNQALLNVICQEV